MIDEEASTYYLRTFGCQMNDHDSERIAGLLEEIGLEPRLSPDDADVLVYNTCSIREKADTRLAGHLGTAARLKRQEPSKLVVVAGWDACLFGRGDQESHPGGRIGNSGNHRR